MPDMPGVKLQLMRVITISHTHPIKSCLEGAMPTKLLGHHSLVVVVYAEYTGDKVGTDIM